MKSRRLTLILAVEFAVIAGASVYAFTSSADQRATLSKQPVTVLVAALQIPAGQTLAKAQAEGMIKSEVFPASTVPAEAIRQIDSSNQDLIASSPIQAGALLRSSDFSDSVKSSSGLTIPSGFVAITLDLKESQRLGSFVAPGSKIALFDTYNLTKGRNQTNVLVPSVLVLAVGGNTAANGFASGNANLITIAVSTWDAARVVEAQSTGELYAALIGDTEPSDQLDVSSTGLFKGER